MTFCAFCGGRLEAGNCAVCAQAPYDRPPPQYDPATGAVTLAGALNKVPIIGFHHSDGKRETLVSLESVRETLQCAAFL